MSGGLRTHFLNGAQRHLTICGIVAEGHAIVLDNATCANCNRIVHSRSLHTVTESTCSECGAPVIDGQHPDNEYCSRG